MYVAGGYSKGGYIEVFTKKNVLCTVFLQTMYLQSNKLNQSQMFYLSLLVRAQYLITGNAPTTSVYYITVTGTWY